MKIDLRLPLVETSVRRELQYIILSAQISKIPITKLAESVGINRKKFYRVLHGETSYRQATAVTFTLLAKFPPVSQSQLDEISKAINTIHEKITQLSKGGETHE
ncbi:hypothetical protein [Bacillus pseudomycoides]|uniref:hypothetical protein n=1 Tax=Bacillus pseudomycoides TaxID=64104 RepID=UPI00059CC1E0|nr:hypothetical protein [Bacillus pseudomycoides]